MSWRGRAGDVPAMSDGELIVFNNRTLWDTPEREAAVAEIRKRGLSRNGFYTAAAHRAARVYIENEGGVKNA